MIAAVHQPNYIPWMGYFYKIFRSNIFVILDDVQYIKRGYINRNKIKTHQGGRWLTIPVYFEDNSRCKINEVYIDDKIDWRSNHLKNVEMNYKKSNFYYEFFPILQNLLLHDCKTLSDFNINIIEKICEIFDIKTQIILSSQFDIQEKGTMRIIELCKLAGATKYLSGRGGAKYQDEQAFDHSSIELEYSDFCEKPYTQLWGDFERGMSVIDYIFNCGFDIKKYWMN